MVFTTNIYMLDILLSIVCDRRYQIVVGLISMVYFIWRQPTPRKRSGNRAIFITGCDTGMGHRIARRLDELKVHVFAGCLFPDGEGAKALKESCSSRLHIVPLDVTNDKMVQDAAKYVQDNIPEGEKGLYAVINNAGVLPYLHFELTTLDIAKETIEINFMGSIRVTKTFLPLVQKVPGRIVTITSIMARIIWPETAVYTATKHALDAFYSVLRLDMARSGVRFPVIEPGNFATTTNIMQYTQRHLDSVWNSMSEKEKAERRCLYEDLKRRMLNKKQLPEEKQEENYKYLLRDVEDALFAEDPCDRYVSAPLIARIVFVVLRLAPASLRKKVVQSMRN